MTSDTTSRKESIAAMLLRQDSGFRSTHALFLGVTELVMTWFFRHRFSGALVDICPDTGGVFCSRFDFADRQLHPIYLKP